MLIAARRSLKNKPQVLLEPNYYRSGADDGLYCCVLVPLTTLSGITALKSQEISLHNVLNYDDIIFACVSSTVLFSSRRPLDLAVGISCLIPIMVNMGLCPLALMFLLSILLYLEVTNIPKLFPKSFSFGELSVVLQLVALVSWRACYSFNQSYFTGMTTYEQSTSVVSVIGVFSAMFATVISVYFYNPRRAWLFYVSYLLIAFLLAYFPLYSYLHINPVLWLLYFLFGSTTRMLLFVYCAACSVCASTIVWLYNKPKSQPTEKGVSTVTRKLFHIVVLLIYLPGLAGDARFMTLASSVVLVVLVLLEAIRLEHVPPWGEALDEAFGMFVDEKDSGRCILTHIYLLIGLSSPLWITYNVHAKGTLPLYSGVLSLAVGDTAASVGGTMFGVHCWPRTKKTIEGTVCCVVSQIAMLYIMTFLGIIPCPPVTSTLVTLVLVSCYEAFTQQIDNLVLPLLTYSMLTVT